MFRDYLELAITNLRHRKLRSWLTIIGVIIGIAAISSMLSLSQGMYDAIYHEFEMMGTNTIMILPGSGGAISPMLSSLGAHLKSSDVDIVKTVPGVQYAIPTTYQTAEIKYGKETKATFVYGIPANDGNKFLESFHGINLLEGRMFRRGDVYKAIVGYDVYKNMFSDKINVGRYIEINGVKFRVIGVLGQIGDRMDDDSITIPMEACKETFGTDKQVDMIFVKVQGGVNVNKVADKIKSKLKNAHGKEDFQVLTSADLLKKTGVILGLISIIAIGIAAISLFVGAIGIMNTMYMSVIERTREIGVMKSVGARKRDILTIFILESGLIGLSGGAIGLIVGLGFAKIVAVYSRHALGSSLLRMAITPELVAFALGVSFLVGVLSGLLPAKSASDLNPVDALRYE